MKMYMKNQICGRAGVKDGSQAGRWRDRWRGKKVASRNRNTQRALGTYHIYSRVYHMDRSRGENIAERVEGKSEKRRRKGDGMRLKWLVAVTGAEGNTAR